MSKNIRRDDWESLKPTVCGFGVKDVNYVTQKFEELPKVNGKRKKNLVWECPYYRKWCSMIKRCYSKRYLEKYPSYQGCKVCDEWRYLSKFIEWVDSQPNRDWEKCELDKDFLITGNKVYSPETVVFINSVVNTFIIDHSEIRGNRMIGINYRFDCKKHYRAICNNPFTKKLEHIGYYLTEVEAHKAWQERKHKHALQLADLQSDPRIAKILRERYSPDKDWTRA